MIVLPCKQRSPEWVKARLGIPTASQASRIMTEKTRKPSSQQDAYMHALLAEWLTGVPSSVEAKAFMDRGARLESWAVDWYKLQKDCDVEHVGLVLRDDRMVACSPDGLVGEDGGLEVKCPSAAVHVAHLLHGQAQHYGQVQWSMWLTGRAWWDVLSYNPEIQPALVRVHRDPEYIAALSSLVGEFVERMLGLRELLLQHGCEPREALGVPAGMGDWEPF